MPPVYSFTDSLLFDALATIFQLYQKNSNWGNFILDTDQTFPEKNSNFFKPKYHYSLHDGEYYPLRLSPILTKINSAAESFSVFIESFFSNRWLI